ncbi:MAG: hypothetical protein INR65_08425 [Gluconacetobacter diazotrophicus]|nr:hypothetical protein [Gluconacetobacter diazotrophicus]
MLSRFQRAALSVLLLVTCAGCDITGKAPSAPAYRQGDAAPLSDPPSSAP